MGASGDTRAPSGTGSLWRSPEPALRGVPVRHSGDQSPLTTHVVPNKVGAAYAGSTLFGRRRLMDDWAAYLAGDGQ